MIKNKKIIWAIDIFLVGTMLLAILGYIGYVSPQVIAPIDNFVSDKNTILFSVGSSEYILIDDNLDFSSPEKVYVKDGAEITLIPGKYYWKTKNNDFNEIRTLDILSNIDLKIVSVGEEYNIVNSGNLDLNVEVYDNQTKVGEFDLSPLQNKEMNGTKFIGAQYE